MNFKVIVQRYWLRVAIAGVVWFCFFGAFNLLSSLPGIKPIIDRISVEFILGTTLTLITGVWSGNQGKIKERKSYVDLEIGSLKKIIHGNNDAMIDTSRRLEDALDGITLELKRLDEQALTDAELRSLITRNGQAIETLGIEQAKQKERLAQGDRLLYALDLIAGLIAQTAINTEKVRRMEEDTKNDFRRDNTPTGDT